MKARDIHFLVSDTFSRGRPYWPKSRAALQGLRLREVADAIKIFTAQTYCDEIRGVAPVGMYSTLKKNWSELYGLFPMAFIRVEDWDAAQQIETKEGRELALLLSEMKWSRPEEQNEEEKDFWEAETYDGFINYLESLPREYPHILTHVLGHLSTRYVYTESTGAVTP